MFHFSRNIFLPHARVRAECVQEFIWPGHLVRHRHATQRTAVARVFGLKMKPHHELFRARIEDDFWSFENATARDRTLRIIAHGQRDAFVAPVVKIARGINMDADVRRVAHFASEMVFAEPEINSIVKQNAAAVGVDMDTIVVRPQFAGAKRFFRFSPHDNSRTSTTLHGSMLRCNLKLPFASAVKCSCFVAAAFSRNRFVCSRFGFSGLPSDSHTPMALPFCLSSVSTKTFAPGFRPASSMFNVAGLPSASVS